MPPTEISRERAEEDNPRTAEEEHWADDAGAGASMSTALQMYFVQYMQNLQLVDT